MDEDESDEDSSSETENVVDNIGGAPRGEKKYVLNLIIEMKFISLFVNCCRITPQGFVSGFFS